MSAIRLQIEDGAVRQLSPTERFVLFVAFKGFACKSPDFWHSGDQHTEFCCICVPLPSGVQEAVCRC